MANNLVKAIRAARKASNKGANKIDGIRAIRQTLDNCGLLEAKELYENLIDGNWHVPATDLAARWCETHWMLDDDCSCAIGAEEVKKAVADCAAHPGYLNLERSCEQNSNHSQKT